MPDYREFLRVLENQKPGRAVMFEFCFSHQLAEQLAWRCGNHLWSSEKVRINTLIEAFWRAGFDTATIEFCEENGKLACLAEIENELPDGMKLCGGLRQTFKDHLANGATEKQSMDLMLMQYDSLTDSPAVCAVMIRDSWNNLDKTEIATRLNAYAEFVKLAHSKGKPCIWMDCGKIPVPIDFLDTICFDAVHLNKEYNIPVWEFLQKYGSRYAVLGDTQLHKIEKAKPKDIIQYITQFYDITDGKGYAYGTGNLFESEIPYLSFISALSVLKRLK